MFIDAEYSLFAAVMNGEL